MPPAINRLLAVSKDDGGLAVLLGFWFGMSHRHLWPHRSYPSPPGCDMAGPLS
jgi:hypothetical protein